MANVNSSALLTILGIIIGASLTPLWLHLIDLFKAHALPDKRPKRAYTWKPQAIDQRDHQFVTTATHIPTKVDLKDNLPPVYDQGKLGSCSANAIAAAIDYGRKKQGLSFITPSRLFIYYNERVLGGSVTTDSGASLRDGIKSVAKQGTCHEKDWPYSDNKTAFKKKPPVKLYTEALTHKAVKYQAVKQDIASIKGCLASGYPIVMGITIFESFESATIAKTGVLDLPKAKEKSMGGHALLIVGYDDVSKRITVRNSWGTDWGQSGYFTMPYAYITDPNLACDFWAILAEEKTTN